MRMTIAQKRWAEVVRLARIKEPDAEEPSEEALREASRNMNSLYRLIGLSERNFYLSNDERTANLKSTARSEDREWNWNKRLTKTFLDTYGIEIMWPGLYPKLIKDGRGEISIYLYD